jgi:hypothetical protein
MGQVTYSRSWSLKHLTNWQARPMEEQVSWDMMELSR